MDTIFKKMFKIKALTFQVSDTLIALLTGGV